METKQLLKNDRILLVKIEKTIIKLKHDRTPEMTEMRQKYIELRAKTLNSIRFLKIALEAERML